MGWDSTGTPSGVWPKLSGDRKVEAVEESAERICSPQPFFHISVSIHRNHPAPAGEEGYSIKPTPPPAPASEEGYSIFAISTSIVTP